MFGTQGASNLQQKDYGTLREAHVDPAGRSNRAAVICEKVDATLLVHGGDFAWLRHATAATSLQELLKTNCTAEIIAQIGDGDQAQEAVILKRVARFCAEGCRRSDGHGTRKMYQRHVDVLLAELEVADDQVISAVTPRVKTKSSKVEIFRC